MQLGGGGHYQGFKVRSKMHVMHVPHAHGAHCTRRYPLMCWAHCQQHRMCCSTACIVFMCRTEGWTAEHWDCYPHMHHKTRCWVHLLIQAA